MIASKNLNKKSGFTFVEIVTAIFIIGSAVTTLLGLQGLILRKSSDYLGRTSRIFYTSNLITDNKMKESIKEKIETLKQIKKPETSIQYTEKKISEKSELKKFIENISIIKATTSWKDGLKNKEEDIITFVYKTKEEKSEK